MYVYVQSEVQWSSEREMRNAPTEPSPHSPTPNVPSLCSALAGTEPSEEGVENM